MRLNDRVGGLAGKQVEAELNGHARERVADIQRARMLTAMVELCAECGAASVTVAHVVARSGVSRRTFYEIFQDREACFLAAFEDSVALARERILAVYDVRASWCERIRLALAALLDLFDERPSVGRLLIVESLAAGPLALECRQRALAPAIAAVDEGRGGRTRGVDPPQLTAEGVVGAVFSVLHARLQEQDGPRLLELLNALMSMIVLPYLGSAAARRERERSKPVRAEHDMRVVGDPLRDLDMRLTYRTVRVLHAIATAPGSSNRDVGVASGVTDQGQMSKLLARLERLGLVRNSGLAPGQGAPNCWSLTDTGKEIELVVSARARRNRR